MLALAALACDPLDEFFAKSNFAATQAIPKPTRVAAPPILDETRVALPQLTNRTRIYEGAAVRARVFGCDVSTGCVAPRLMFAADG